MSALIVPMMIFVIVCIWPAAAGYGLGLWKPAWSSTKIVGWSSIPAPALLGMFCVYIYSEALLTQTEQCGIDACSFNADLCTIWLVLAGLFAVIGSLTARAGLALARRPIKSSLAAPSE